MLLCSDDVEATPTSSTEGTGNVSLMAQKWVPPDDDIPLEMDALDVDEYINTEDEVIQVYVCIHVCVICECGIVCVCVCCVCVWCVLTYIVKWKVVVIRARSLKG